MKTTNIFANKYVKGGLLIASGLLLGWIFFHSPSAEKAETTAEVHDHAAEGHDIWTCSMHPQIRKDEPGDCPICGMDLIPLLKSDAVMDDQAIEMSESALKLAEVQTSVVTRGNVSKEVRLFGKIQADERLLKTQTAHIPGRIEQLLVNVTGENVRKGQLIARVYSPELLTAQNELLQALEMADKYPAMLDAAREKLRLWKLSDQQISDIEKSGKATTVFDVFATTSGIVANRKVNTGDYVSRGDVLFETIDLSRVWALFDAYESDLSWIKLGQNLEFTAQAIPGKTFNGKITFIDPVVDASTRITKVRVEVPNTGLQFKPEMFVNGIIQSGKADSGDQLIIPQSAVLWTGTRSVVYVKLPGADHPTFKMREITLGSSMKDSYVVMDGLADGEEIVTNGTFSVDAAAQLAGKVSMMNPMGGKVSTGGHDGMDMGNEAETPGATQSRDRSIDEPGDTQRVTLSHPLSKQTIKVFGECEMCKDRIEMAANSVSGVSSADWSSETKMLHVQFDEAKTSSDAIQKAIAKVGHDTEKYNALAFMNSINTAFYVQKY
ncbi:MAG: efflux RND transporter periplasmic adaptor subunit [Bacteroidota bacterium]|nr:efflux RND transporter periplasmic adaptor subunit [Bacteroidota bacterium]